MAVWVEIDLCDGCRRCTRACPYDAMEIKDGKAHVGDRCTSCGACMDACRNEAILTDAKPRVVPDFSDHTGRLGIRGTTRRRTESGFRWSCWVGRKDWPRT